ncbi:EF-hand domain-containing protein [Caulobacter sp. NIBR1757]|uniref:EF-hand domain-containing protein n=1 Tax=Caulobacter sp. NIBR1757 TaxID=3016000 RepID=UPI0022F10C51|nr:EF-hand domain-containing protein [Caulobacter sp. NIBR1757]WGM39900.1 hypothetical protein AMEJIAPC_02840 [Caulobacter sp. NIBR1757]
MHRLPAARFLGLGVILCAVALPAAASPPLNALIARADRDSDGWISYPEFRDARLAAFDRADANHDQILTRAEARAMRADLGLPNRMPGPKTLSAMRAIDANGDNKLSRAEFTVAGRARFAQLDNDHDGRLSRADAYAAMSG